MASAFITVASIPMWSPVTRSMPAADKRRATEQVAATDHQADLHADTHQLADFQRHAIERLGIDTEIFRALRASPLSSSRMHCGEG